MRISDYSVSMTSKNTNTSHRQSANFSSILSQRQAFVEGKASTMHLQSNSGIQTFARPPININIIEINEPSEISAVEEDNSIEVEMKDFDLNKMIMIQKQLEALTGKKVRFHLHGSQRNGTDLSDYLVFIERTRPNSSVVVQQVPLVNGTRAADTQKVNFEANGNVTTTDGRNIDFNLNLDLSRNIVEESGTSVRMVDPLVLNLNSDSAELTDRKIDFDLDSDGKTESISFVGKGSGFLAIDLNGDNKVNNGLELFGAKTGDGFQELAAYDLDKNSWIDENDAVFDKLRLWMKSEDGAESLRTLKAEGVGAIFLGSSKTDFNLLGSDNQKNGALTQTGIFLRENGTVGTIQDVDVAV